MSPCPLSVPLSGDGGPAALPNGTGDEEGSVGSAPYPPELLDDDAAGPAEAPPRAPGLNETVDRVASLKLNETVEYLEDTSSPHGALPFDPNRTGNLSVASRHLLHARLKSYEAQRRLAYRNKLESTDLYWRSARDLQAASLREVAVARGTVLCRLHAEEVTGRAAACIAAGDVHWDTGRHAPPASPTKKRPDARSPGRVPSAPASPPALPGALSNEEAAERALSGFDPPPPPHVSLVESVRRSHAGAAERHQEFTIRVRAQVLPVLERLRDQLTTRAARDGALGDALLAELRAAEVRVAEAWEEYFGAAFASLKEVHSTSCNDERTLDGTYARHRAGPARGSPKEGADRPYVPPRRDVWVADMRYRMAVAFLSACWEKCQGTLAQIFLRMKVDECARRGALQEALSAFLRLQRHLWEELPRAFAEGVPGGALCPPNKEEVEQEVDAAIRRRAREIKAAGGDTWEGGDAGLPKGPVTTAPSPDEFSSEDRSIELDSPLTSILLGRARVVERRGGKLGVWRASLAIVTTDSYLHVFDVPYFTRVKKGSATEVAFHSLVPSLEIPTEKSVGGARRARPAKAPRRAWHALLSPTHSVYLPNCEVEYRPKLGVAAFEVVETVPSASVAAVFSRTTTRKLLFRTGAQEETVDWIVALQAQR